MKRHTIVSKECAIYPGKFIPPPEVQLHKNKTSSLKKPDPPPPKVNLDEFKDHFKLEVVLPGVKKENILISVHANMLSITIFNKTKTKKTTRQTKIHEFDRHYFEKQLVLPDNTDAAFIKAEYADGVLLLRIPKTTSQEKNADMEIVIY
jgi:HSP20 family protein